MSNSYLYPLKLDYISKCMLWGGNNLRDMFGKESTLPKIAETWELSVRDAEMCRIKNGACAGMSVREYISAAGNSVVGAGYNGDKFPLLIKFIDAQDRLSVQVHPDDSYAARVENDVGKTEMWYIVAAREGAEIIYGLADGTTPSDFAAAVERGDISGAMKHCPVHAGEYYFIPSGMLHAIGAGIVIAEIQQNSDLTYRVYDYDRTDADGKKRPLHQKKACDVIKSFSAGEIKEAALSRAEDERDGVGVLLAACRYFTVRAVDALAGNVGMACGEDSFTALLGIEGNGKITVGESEYSFRAGDSFFIPAGMGEYRVRGVKFLTAKAVF